MKKVSKMVTDFMSFVPQIVLIPDSKGNYPLHIAIRNQQKYNIIYQLFGASTDTGKIRDVKTNLLPFMLAAKGNWESEEDQISITYKLLREDPHLVFTV